MVTDLNVLLEGAVPAWHHDVLTAYVLPGSCDELLIEQNVTVDLTKVRGIWHPDYANCSWAELIGCRPPGLPGRLKRLSGHLRQLRDNPGYFVDQRVKDDWSFYRVGDDYCASSGSHRTVVARYFLECNGLPPVVHGVAVKTVSERRWRDRQQIGRHACPAPDSCGTWDVPGSLA